MSKTLAELLSQHLAHRHWSFEKLAAEAHLPRNTVYRWTKGEVRRVRYWQDLVKAARALDLSTFQVNTLLETGGHPTIDALQMRVTTEEERELLSRWSITSPPNNLPAQLTSFVGRQEEIEHITRLLASARLVTLTGPGGSGKTRLAIEVAHSVLEAFDEVSFIDLFSVRDPALVIPTIARTLGVRESHDAPPLRAIETHVRDRRVLLVLDNLEQVVEAAPHVTTLLAAARQVKALVTSRMRLNVRGEHEFPVPPLSLPSVVSGFKELARNPSVALFAERARTADPSFTFTPNSAPKVAEVCARLEGLPLGVELAAARIRQVRLGSMLKRFPARLALASDGPRDAPIRQQTLRATIAWSYDLLSCEEQRLFTGVGVFAGSFVEDAAEAVCAAIGHREMDVPRGLESLVEQNLLRRILDDDNEPRYAMLETIREYALERLTACGDAGTARRAATGYFLELAEEARLEAEGQEYWLRRLATEQANFRTVLGWCKETGDTETGLRLSVALLPLWQLLDYQMEARGWLEAFMADADADADMVPTGLRARGLLWQGLLQWRGTGDDAFASRLFEEALSQFREGGDLDGASETLQAQGDVYRDQEQWARATQRYAESLELAQTSGNAYLVSHGYMGLALCTQEVGQFDTAQRNWELMLQWAEQAGNDASVALALNSLGEMARHNGDWDEAEQYYRRTLHLAKDLGNKSRIALASHNLGYVALYRGELGKARQLFVEGLVLYDERQYLKGVAECLAGLGKLAASEGRLERAAILCGATEAMLEKLGTRLDTLDRADYEATLEMLGSRLGERLGSLLQEGRAMSTQQAVAFAVADR